MSAEYTEEERQAAWAAYYAQQGMDSSATASYSGGASGSGSGSSAPVGLKLAAGASASAGYGGLPNFDLQASANAAANAALGIAAGEQIWDPEMAQQASVYTPGAAMRAGWHPGQTGAGKRETVIRKGGGRVWEDRTLLDWDHKWWRLFVGNVSNDVNERTLDAAFNKYPSYVKSKVVRDRLSEKAKFGFIAFKDPEDFLRAWKEMDGKYVGNRPITLKKVEDDKPGASIQTVKIGTRKAKTMDKLVKNKGKPLNGRPVPF